MYIRSASETGSDVVNGRVSVDSSSRMRGIHKAVACPSQLDRSMAWQGDTRLTRRLPCAAAAEVFLAGYFYKLHAAADDDSGRLFLSVVLGFVDSENAPKAVYRFVRFLLK